MSKCILQFSCQTHSFTTDSKIILGERDKYSRGIYHFLHLLKIQTFRVHVDVVNVRFLL
jgi:hypothetical protein